MIRTGSGLETLIAPVTQKADAECERAMMKRFEAQPKLVILQLPRLRLLRKTELS